MTTHLPISIPDILHGKTVEWERLESEEFEIRAWVGLSRNSILDACRPWILWYIFTTS